MTRVTTTVLVLLLLMNGSVSIMSASGLSEDLDVTLAPGISETMDETVNQLRAGFRPGAGAADTLFATFVAALGVMEIVVTGITAAPTMMMNLGIPAWIVVPLFTPMYAISTLEMVYAVTGRDLV